tara:strand:- start:36 stop:143 length:108 start_codon:yes stop_codon:yes gene_type:complete
MTYQEALDILKNPNNYPINKLKEAMEVVKLKMFER